MSHSRKLLVRSLLAAMVGATILFAILLLVLPYGGYGHSKESAMWAHCMSNIKQLSLGLLMYAEDNGTFPSKANWLEHAKRKMEPDGVIVCPRIPRDVADRFGYAFNSRLDQRRIKDIASPETTPIVFETSLMGRNLSDPVTSLPDPARHREGNNIAYADGHAKSVKP